MTDKGEKERRKQITNDLRKKALEKFEDSLPMNRELFKKLFEYLNIELGDRNCDHTNSITQVFLQENGIIDTENILTWLANNGGYCDCEILANVEEQFE